MKKFHLDPKKAIFLGINGKNPIFVFSINDEINKFFENYSNIKYEDLRSISGLISNADASILAHGRAIIDWNEKNKFCGKCGFVDLHVKDPAHLKICAEDKPINPDFKQRPLLEADF